VCANTVTKSQHAGHECKHRSERARRQGNGPDLLATVSCKGQEQRGHSQLGSTAFGDGGCSFSFLHAMHYHVKSGLIFINFIFWGRNTRMIKKQFRRKCIIRTLWIYH